MIKMTTLQNAVYYTIKNHGEIYISDVAKLIYQNVRKDLRPKNQNNAVICAVREINRKQPNTIDGINRGSKGKLLYIRKSAE